MPTTLTNGIQLPDKGSVDWYSSMQSNYDLIDTHLGNTDIHVTAEDKANWNSKHDSLSQDQLDAIAQVAINTNDIVTLQSDKADASHTHSSSDITDIDDYATKDYVDNSISDLVDNAPDALNTLNELSAALNDDSNFATTVTNALANKADSADLATVATSGDYNDLDNLPTIPTKTSDLSNDSDFVASSNLATVATSGDYDDLSNKPPIPTNTSDLNNDSGFVTLNDFDIPSKTSDLTNDSGFITSSDVPTSTSDLTNDSNFVDTSNSAVASGITSAKVTDYDAHIADTDIHVTASDKTTWNTVTSKANDSDVVHKSGDETIGGVKTFSDNISTKKIISNVAQLQINARSSADSVAIIAGANASDGSGIWLYGKDNATGSDCRIQIYNTAKSRFERVDLVNSQFLPSPSGELDCGGSSNKWKSFNGIEPSSLSLPSDKNARIDISSYITNLGNGDNNAYTVPANGYIYLYFTSVTGIICYSQTSGGMTNYAQTFVRYQGNGQLYAFFPVRKDDKFVVQIYTSSTAVVQNAYFIPCQGNV